MISQVFAYINIPKTYLDIDTDIYIHTQAELCCALPVLPWIEVNALPQASDRQVSTDSFHREVFFLQQKQHRSHVRKLTAGQHVYSCHIRHAQRATEGYQC